MHVRRTVQQGSQGDTWTKTGNKKQIIVSIGANDETKIFQFIRVHINAVNKNISIEIDHYTVGGLTMLKQHQEASHEYVSKARCRYDNPSQYH